ncbi:mRNA capping enzyme, alpha subunit [Calocera viscosa TUFC12733]|uniref:mRNA-capping enzyme subunit alpha n=1 Tax=Calocera viscosa (strain TUFC12733) TaxID=1330018 RepID=A0A167LKU6_CALVF|nr:mRNA capping enzyme, alpha subunit [Calocera viscosa TUFC12733]
MPATSPAIPGQPTDHEIESTLRAHVAFLCGTAGQKFPGSQPVSFGAHSLQTLENEDYWVCEKSDGIRVLLLVVINPRFRRQEVYLIDRHNRYYEQDGLVFPHFENPMDNLRDTLLDCELVEDTDPRTRVKTLRLLIFDCLVADKLNVMDRPLTKRYGRIREIVYKPFEQMLRKFPQVGSGLPFQIAVKEMRPSYHVPAVLSSLPALQHTSDGLIFTPVPPPYTPGTDPRLLKWKPAEENSIDLLLLLHFPASPSSPASPASPAQPDLAAKPRAGLYVWLGGESYDFFDELVLPAKEWEGMKASGEQWHGRVVEVVWDARGETWTVLRFRDDKPHANHVTVVDKVLESIRDGVGKEELINAAPSIRTAWKAREERAAHPPSAPQQLQLQPLQPQLQQEQEKPIRVELGIFPRVGGGKDLLGRLYGPVVVDGWVR